MLTLGATIGRQEAHDVIYDAAQEAGQGHGDFATMLSEDERVTKHLSLDQIQGMLDPAAYTGESGDVARMAAAKARTSVGG